MTSDREAESDRRSQPMRLEGVEALELYIIEIEQNLAELATQIALLRASLAERRKLLSTIATACREKEQPPCPMH